jgi:hypothetical protein
MLALVEVMAPNVASGGRSPVFHRRVAQQAGLQQHLAVAHRLAGRHRLLRYGDAASNFGIV